MGDGFAPLKRLAMVQVQPPRNPNKPLTSFFISDILFSRREAEERIIPPKNQDIKRPWMDSPIPSSDEGSCRSDSDEDIEIDVADSPPQKRISNHKPTPLDALFQMASKTFDGNESGNLSADDLSRRDQLNLFSKSQPPKKRRKSRTAFTNQQIYELEKRFLYQKYLTPADRDEIASSLALTNAQVITWFQNRRAKLKRDLEELKADVTAAKIVDTVDPSFNSAEEVAFFKRNGSNHNDQGSPSKLISMNSHRVSSPTTSDSSIESQSKSPQSDCSDSEKHSKLKNSHRHPTSPSPNKFKQLHSPKSPSETGSLSPTSPESATDMRLRVTFSPHLHTEVRYHSHSAPISPLLSVSKCSSPSTNSVITPSTQLPVSFL